MGINIDYTISIGSMFDVAAFVGGGLIVVGILKNTITTMQREFEGMQREIREFAKAIVAIAVQKQRIDNLDEDLRDLKRGRGYIINRPPPEGLV